MHQTGNIKGVIDRLNKTMTDLENEYLISKRKNQSLEVITKKINKLTGQISKLAELEKEKNGIESQLKLDRSNNLISNQRYLNEKKWKEENTMNEC